MVSNSRMQITLLRFLFKNFNIIEKVNQQKYTEIILLYALFFRNDQLLKQLPKQ